MQDQQSTTQQLMEKDSMQLILEGKLALYFDELLQDRIGFGWYQIKHVLILLLIDANDGAQLVMMSFMNPILKKEWGISSMWIAALSSLFYVGASIGSMITGVIGDTYGRRPAIIVSSIALIVISLAFYWCQNLYQMSILRFFYGFCYGFSLPLPSSMISELIPLQLRGKSLVILNFFVSVGKLFGCILAWICLDSFTQGDWRIMMIYSSLPSVIVLAGTIFLMRESPRFLISQGKYDRGFNILNQMISDNHSFDAKVLTQEEMDNLCLWKVTLFNNQQKVSVQELFNAELRSVSIRLWIIWLMENAQYFGQLVILPFILGSTNQSFASYFYTILGEAPSILISYFIVDIKGLGRKNSLTIFLVLSALFHLLCYTVTKSYMPVLTSVARFCMKQCFAMMYPLSAESYPTPLRSMGFGWCSGIGRLGAAFIPYLMFLLLEIDLFSSFIIFTVVSSIAAVASHTLPFDTCGRQLDVVNKLSSNFLELQLIKNN